MSLESLIVRVMIQHEAHTEPWEPPKWCKLCDNLGQDYDRIANENDSLKEAVRVMDLRYNLAKQICDYRKNEIRILEGELRDCPFYTQPPGFYINAFLYKADLDVPWEVREAEREACVVLHIGGAAVFARVTWQFATLILECFEVRIMRDLVSK